MRDPSLAASDARPTPLWLVLLALVFIMMAVRLGATGRIIVIDNNTFEVDGDAYDGQLMPLSFPVDYGAGLQSEVTINLPAAFDGNGLAQVGLTFTNSPTDRLFATIVGGGRDAPGAYLSNPHEVSTPTHTVSNATNFDFGTVFNVGGVTVPFCSPGCSVYGMLQPGANFNFVSLASSGRPGDFELNLTCNGPPCTNIGFSLAGENFSADSFDAATPPPNLVNYSYFDGRAVSGVIYRSWTFLFSNSSAVPEPSTWISMLVGFGLIGIAFSRKRSRNVCST